MLNETVEDMQDGIDGVLAACACPVKRVAPLHWRLTHRNGHAHRTDVRVEEGWFVMSSAIETSRGRRPERAESVWDCLKWNARLPGGVKIVLARNARVPHLVAEVPLDADDPLPLEEIGHVAEDFMESLERLTCTRTRGTSASGVESTEDVEDNGIALRTLCESAGWKYTMRPSGRLSIPIGYRDGDGSHFALLCRRKTGVIHAFAELAVCENPPRPVRDALGVMLLGMSGLVRMARAAAEEDGPGATLRLEVVVEKSPDAVRLAHALCALSVGTSRFCGAEVRVLARSEEVAKEYLSVRGWSRGPQTRVACSGKETRHE